MNTIKKGVSPNHVWSKGIDLAATGKGLGNMGKTAKRENMTARNMKHAKGRKEKQKASKVR